MRKITFLFCLFLSLLAINASAGDTTRTDTTKAVSIKTDTSNAQMRGPQSLPVITVIYDAVAGAIDVQCSDESTFDIRVYDCYSLLIGMSDSSCPTVEGIRTDGPVTVQVLSEHWQAEVTL